MPYNFVADIFSHKETL